MGLNLVLGVIIKKKFEDETQIVSGGYFRFFGFLIFFQFCTFLKNFTPNFMFKLSVKATAD